MLVGGGRVDNGGKIGYVSWWQCRPVEARCLSRGAAEVGDHRGGGRGHCFCGRWWTVVDLQAGYVSSERESCVQEQRGRRKSPVVSHIVGVQSTKVKEHLLFLHLRGLDNMILSGSTL